MPINTNKQKREKELRMAEWPRGGDGLYKKLGATREELAGLQMAFQGTIVLPRFPPRFRLGLTDGPLDLKSSRPVMFFWHPMIHPI